MPHSNQGTQANIESYHGTLKCWFSLETKGLRGHQIHYLVWRLTTIAWHYMQTSKMKKRGFIKNKVVECIVGMSVEKAALIPIKHLFQPSFETNGYWIIKNQHLANLAYKVKYPFVKYSSSTCEWMLQRNLCKHQIVIIFMVPMLPKSMLLIIVEHSLDSIVEV